MNKYKLRDKKNRNERLYQFFLNNPTWTYEAIANVFHISKQRAWLIIQKEQERNRLLPE